MAAVSANRPETNAVRGAMNEREEKNGGVVRVAVQVRGIVQGVGFRPFVYRIACQNGLAGWVQNEADTVRIEVEGPAQRVDRFLAALREDPPPQARLERIEVRPIPRGDGRPGEFVIRSSPQEGSPRPTLPADLAICAGCREEIRTPGQRRYRYPFTNCTCCGPRWSVVLGVPYDRPRTSMAGFAMCPACAAEYADPADRRFHAQPIACPVCGPHLEWRDVAGRLLASYDHALDLAAAAVRAGQIVALKGLGGFQLLVDATAPGAVARLRDRKRRPHKPFALMFATLEEVMRHCEVSGDEARLLQSPQAPIVLLRRRNKAPALCDIAAEVAPGNPYLGVMLPYTPLHELLMEAVGRPIVCTSGNLSEEPMAVDTQEALDRLGQIADGFLVHNRPIVRPVDDSVVRWGPAGPMVLRRARGYAPRPMPLEVPGPPVLALGGHLKNVVALALEGQAILSAHVGDLDNVLSVEVHRRAAADLVDFFQVRPAAVACDLHPDYASTRYAEELAQAWNVPLIRVQHHHAHVGAVMAEFGLEGPVLGLAWDGTGYGQDGTVWGGEALWCHQGAYCRVGHLRTFPLPGGDQAVRQPRRSALGLLYEALGPEAAVEVARAWFTPEELRNLLVLLARRRCPRTSSMGRLFDAVACLCGLGDKISFEGQAAMALEFAADTSCEEPYPLDVGDDPLVADWQPMVEAILADLQAGASVASISARFHNTLAQLAVEWCKGAGQRAPSKALDVMLCGGCFQNAVLAQRVFEQLDRAGFRVHLPREVPPGDGGIALGQAWVARWRLQPSPKRLENGR